MMIPYLLVVGSSNLDRILRVPRLPAKGETVSGGAYLEAHGGKGANQAVAAARAGGHVVFVTGLGEDTAGMEMLGAFRAEGMEVSASKNFPGVATGTAVILFDEKGDNQIAVAAGANACLQPEHVADLPARFPSAGLVLLQMEVTTETNLAVIAAAKASGLPVILNYAPTHDLSLPLADVDTLIVNETEAEALSGLPLRNRDEAIAAARALRGRGPSQVMVTLGADGVCVCGDETFHFPAPRVKAVDATAAGDTFCGAYAVARLERRSLRDAVDFATRAAALCVTRAGAQCSIPLRSEYACGANAE